MQTSRRLLNNAIFLSLLLIFIPSVSAAPKGQVTNPHTKKPDFCIVVEEEDQSPRNKKCKPLRVTNGSLTDNGSYFSLATGSSAEVNNLETITTNIAINEIPTGTAANTVVYKLLPDCNVAGSALAYEDSTQVWSCRAGLGGGSIDTTTVDDTTWSDAANSTNTWTFDLSGTNTSLIFGSALFTFSHGITLSAGNITQAAGTTLFMGGLLDATGAVDMDYGSADITDHTFISDGGTAIIDGGLTLDNDTVLGVDGSAIFNEQAGSVDFRIESANNTNMFFVDGSADCIGINQSDCSAHTLAVTGHVGITVTAGEDDTHGLEITSDAAGFGDHKALEIQYDTGNLSSGETATAILIDINEIDASGGDVVGLTILSTDGGADELIGIVIGAGIDPLRQSSGVFINATLATNNTNTTDVPDMRDGSTGTNTTIFASDNDFIIIGANTSFTQIQFVIETGFGNPGIQPVFAYSTTGTNQFTNFTPTDGTDGFKNAGAFVVAWGEDETPGFVADAVTTKFDIRVTRTANPAGSVSLFYAKSAATVPFTIDKLGNQTFLTYSFEGSTDDGNEHTLNVIDPQSDRLFIFPDDDIAAGDVLVGSDANDLAYVSIATDGTMLVGDGSGAPAAESGATLRTSIGVAIGSNVQAWDAELDTIAALTETNGNVMFVAGGVWTSDATPAIDCTDCTNVGGATAWDDIADPDNNGLTTITFDNAELSLFTGNNDAVADFFTIQNTDADHANNLYLLNLDYSADDGDVDADFIKFQDSGGIVMTIQQNGEIATDGGITAGGAIAGSNLSGTNTGDVTHALDLVSGNGITGGQDNVMVGADGDVTLNIELKDNAENGVGNTSSVSGLEFESAELTLLQGCANNEILKWIEASDDWQCKADDDSGGATAYDNIGDPTGAGEIVFADTETAKYSSASDGETFFTISLTAADLAADTEGLLISAVDDDDANYIPFEVRDDSASNNDLLFQINYLGEISKLSARKRISISATSGICRTTTGCTDPTQTETSTNKINYFPAVFADDADDYWQVGPIITPENWDGGTITFSYSWIADSDTTSGGVSIDGACVSIADDEALDSAFGTAVEVSDDWTAAGDYLASAESSAITCAGAGAGELMYFQLFRDVDDADDDLAGGTNDNFNLIAIYITFTIDQLSTED